MAKIVNYHCKDCGQNNNGWCPFLKMNGLKEVTENDCINGGGHKTPKGVKSIQPTNDEDDILAKAHEEMASINMPPVPLNISEVLKNKKEDDKISKLLIENLSIDIDSREGMDLGSSITTITLKYKDVPISDIDFGFSPFKGIYIK